MKVNLQDNIRARNGKRVRTSTHTDKSHLIKTTDSFYLYQHGPGTEMNLSSLL